MSQFNDIVDMLRRFVWCNMYAVVDRLANATGKEVVQSTLYEALRIARSSIESGRPLCTINDKEIRAYVASENSINNLLNELDKDLVGGLEIIRKIAIRALTYPTKEER